MSDFLTFVLLVLGLLSIGAFRRDRRERLRLRLREMVHQERLLALEKGQTAADLPAGADFEAGLDGAWTERVLEAGWDRRIALAIGLIMLFGSAGALLFAWLAPVNTGDAAVMKFGAWLAVIPLMASFGLLLFYRLTAPRGR